MTKEEAIKHLKRFINENFNSRIGCYLPIMDEKIVKINGINSDGVFQISEYSFKGLLKIAYDLEDKKV